MDTDSETMINSDSWVSPRTTPRKRSHIGHFKINFVANRI